MAADALVTHETPTEPTVRTPPAVLAAIRAARAGDHAAFEELMILTERRVAQLAWAVLGDAEEVKEATQETFLRVFRHLGGFDETRDFASWLTRVTVNVSRDLLRRRKSRSRFEPLGDDTVFASTERRADDELVHRSELALLRRAINELPPRERLAVTLRDIEGLSTGEVAAALGNTVATVRVQLCRARAKLRGLIESLRGFK